MQNKRYVILAVAGIFIALIVAVSLENRAHDKGDFSSEQSTGKPTPRSTESAVENQENQESVSREHTPSMRPEIIAKLDSFIAVAVAGAERRLSPNERHDEKTISWFEGLSNEVAYEVLGITLRAQAETKTHWQGRSWEAAEGAYTVIAHLYLLPKLSDEQVLDIVLEDYRPGKDYASKVYERMISAVFLKTSNESLLSLQPYIEARKDDPPWNLIEYLYSKYLGLALEAVAPIYVGDEELSPLLAELDAISMDIGLMESARPEKRNEIIATYLSIVKRCAEHDEWSLRAYAAAALKLKPSIRTPELLRRLGNDKVEVVRKIIRKISEEEAPKGRFD